MKIKEVTKQEAMELIRKQLPAMQDELDKKINKISGDAAHIEKEIEDGRDNFYRGKK